MNPFNIIPGLFEDIERIRTWHDFVLYDPLHNICLKKKLTLKLHPRNVQLLGVQN